MNSESPSQQLVGSFKSPDHCSGDHARLLHAEHIERRPGVRVSRVNLGFGVIGLAWAADRNDETAGG